MVALMCCFATDKGILSFKYISFKGNALLTGDIKLHASGADHGERWTITIAAVSQNEASLLIPSTGFPSSLKML